jgi:hypothetical protein
VSFAIAQQTLQTEQTMQLHRNGRIGFPAARRACRLQPGVGQIKAEQLATDTSLHARVIDLQDPELRRDHRRADARASPPRADQENTR